MQDETQANVFDFISQALQKDDIVLFMKGTKRMPQCGFSAQVVQILQHYLLPFQDINVFEIKDLRDGIKQFSNWPTIPQLYVRGNFIGGADIVRDLHQSGTFLSTLGIEKDL